VCSVTELVQSEPRIGTVIAGRYVLCERIGAGGMGVVFRAAQATLSRTVAIKLLHPRLAREACSLRRFHDEAIAASRVSHPGTVMVLEWGETAEGTPYIVMEDVRGANLGRVLHRDRRMPVTRVVDIVRQVLAALGEVHAAGVVHGDVKTDNLLVEETGTGDRVRLIDFGLARLLDREAIAPERSVEVSGTPEYMAPEVIGGEAPTPAADLYGAGVVLYELLVGATPFAGGSASAVMKRHLEDDVIPPSLRSPDRGISPLLDHIVMTALDRSPENRFATAAEFAAALACPVSKLMSSSPPAATDDPPREGGEHPTRAWSRAA
jgi:serine/threonine protein kinase